MSATILARSRPGRSRSPRSVVVTLGHSLGCRSIEMGLALVQE